MEKRCYICGSSRHMCSKCPRKGALPESFITTVATDGRRSNYRQKYPYYTSEKSTGHSRRGRSGRNSQFKPVNERSSNNDESEPVPTVKRSDYGKRIKRYCTICRRYGHGTKDCWFNKSMFRTESDVHSPSQYSGDLKAEQDKLVNRVNYADEYQADIGDDQNCRPLSPQYSARERIDGRRRGTSTRHRSSNRSTRSRRQRDVYDNDNTHHDLFHTQKSKDIDHYSRNSNRIEIVRTRSDINGSIVKDEPETLSILADHGESNIADLSTYDSDDFQSEYSREPSSESDSEVVISSRRPRRQQMQRIESPKDEKSSPSQSSLTPTTITRRNNRIVDDNGKRIASERPGQCQSSLRNQCLPSDRNKKHQMSLIVEKEYQDRKSEGSFIFSSQDEYGDYQSDAGNKQCTDKVNTGKKNQPFAHRSQKAVLTKSSVNYLSELSNVSSENALTSNDEDDCVAGFKRLNIKSNDCRIEQRSSRCQHSPVRIDDKRKHKHTSIRSSVSSGGGSDQPCGQVDKLDRTSRSPIERYGTGRSWFPPHSRHSRHTDRNKYGSTRGRSSASSFKSNKYGRVGRNDRFSKERSTARDEVCLTSRGLFEVYSANEVTCYNCGRMGHKSFDCPESGVNRRGVRSPGSNRYS